MTLPLSNINWQNIGRAICLLPWQL